MSKRKIDLQCVRSFQSGSVNAFEEVYCFYRDSVYFFALSMVKHEADAEEVVQETFMLAKSKIETLIKLDSFNSWLFKIAYHSALKILRNRKKVDYDDVVYDFTADVSDSASEVLNKKEIINAAIKEIEKMPEKILIVAKLHYLDGLSLKEISDVLEIPIGTVKSRLKRAREIVQPALKKSGFTPAKYFVFAFNPIMFIAFKQLVQAHAFSQSTSTKIYNKILENGKLIEAGAAGGVGGVGGVSIITKVLSALTLAGVAAFAVYNTTQVKDLEIKQIAYYKEYTNSNIEVEIVLNQIVNMNDVEIKYENESIQYIVKEKAVYFNATKNGEYTIKVKNQKEKINISNIDRKAPMMFGALTSDDNILMLDVNDEKSGIDYQRSYAMQNSVKHKIGNTDKIDRLATGEVILHLYDVAGNFSEYAIDFDADEENDNEE